MILNSSLPAGYQFFCHYAEDTQLRESLNSLTGSQWGIRVLNQGDVDYHPFSILYENEVVANISVGRFDLVVNGKRQDANMIQTVLTHPDHRNKGLIRTLFHPVQEFIKNDTNVTYFPANKDKQAFYAKFGYQAVPFAECFTAQAEDTTDALAGMFNVDYDNKEAKAALESALSARKSVSNVLGYENRNGLFYWYCDNFHGEKIYYIPALNCYLLCEWEGDQLTLFDIVSSDIPTLKQLLPYLFNYSELRIKTIRFMFCPDKLLDNYYTIENTEDHFYSCDNFKLPKQSFCIPETLRG
jgi:GNAT superfamily N-acetyltransferase